MKIHTDDQLFMGVPTTIDRCALFEACPKYTFFVDNTPTTTRRVWDGVEVRNQANNDIENCGSVGVFRAQTGDCIVDRLVLPLISVLFLPQPHAIHLPIVEPTDNIPTSSFLHQDNLKPLFDQLLQHCPAAFDAKFADFRAVAITFSQPYPPDRTDNFIQEGNALFMKIFGNKRGFETLEEYELLSDCALYILQTLEAHYDADISSTAYADMAAMSPPRSGRDLYLFSRYGTLNTPFMWSWQCLLMASQFEGGASRDWMERIGENTELSCPNFNVAVNNSNTLTLKRRLMTAPYLFNSRDFRVQTSGLNLIRDIQKTLAYAIEQLKISNIQDTYCLALPKDISENCEVTRPQNVDGCYLRAGIDKSKTLDTMNDEIEGSILSRHPNNFW